MKKLNSSNTWGTDSWQIEKWPCILRVISHSCMSLRSLQAVIWTRNVRFNKTIGSFWPYRNRRTALMTNLTFDPSHHAADQEHYFVGRMAWWSLHVYEARISVSSFRQLLLQARLTADLKAMGHFAVFWSFCISFIRWMKEILIILSIAYDIV